MKQKEVKFAAYILHAKQFGLLHRIPPFYTQWLLLPFFNNSNLQIFVAQNTGSTKYAGSFNEIIKIILPYFTGQIVRWVITQNQ